MMVNYVGEWVIYEIHKQKLDTSYEVACIADGYRLHPMR